MFAGSTYTQVHAPIPPPLTFVADRVFAIAVDRVRELLPTSLAITSEIRLVEQGSSWRASLDDPRSFFDVGALTVAFAEGDAEGEPSTRVTVRLTFESSTPKLSRFAWLINSLIGIPFATLWRTRSSRRTQERVETIVASVWNALAAHGVVQSERPYR